MTFSQLVKDELLSAKFGCERCTASFLSAVLGGAVHSDSRTLYRTDSRDTATRLAELIVGDTGAVVTILEPDVTASRKNKVFLLSMEDREDYCLFRERYAMSPAEWMASGRPAGECCLGAYLRGVLFSAGTIVNPRREYHLELKLADESDAQVIGQLLCEAGHPMKRTRRKGFHILYVKESEQIEDFLVYCGAVRCAFDLMNIKIEKDLRNNANRIVNCETANIQKTVTASMKQVEDIRLIEQARGLEFLEDDLRETARARLQNPEMSLKELCRELGGQITRSGLNHRLKRLCTIAQELRDEQNYRRDRHESSH